jgi:hypothetical protein
VQSGGCSFVYFSVKRKPPPEVVRGKSLRYKNASFAIIEAGLATATEAKEVCHLWQMTMVVYHIRNGIANII